MGRAVAEDVDRDDGGEIEIFLPVLAEQIGPVSSHRPHIATRIDRHERRDGHLAGFLSS
jgi:hypothetical protein